MPRIPKGFNGSLHSVLMWLLMVWKPTSKANKRKPNSLSHIILNIWHRNRMTISEKKKFPFIKVKNRDTTVTFKILLSQPYEAPTPHPQPWQWRYFFMRSCFSLGEVHFPLFFLAPRPVGFFFSYPLFFKIISEVYQKQRQCETKLTGWFCFVGFCFVLFCVSKGCHLLFLEF